MELRLDRVGGLVDQFDSTLEFAFERFEGLTDDEWLWEPSPGAASVRRRGSTAWPRSFGPGAWMLDGGFDDVPSPARTIAWEVSHLTWALAGRWEWTFGERAAEPDGLVDFSPTAAPGLAMLASWCDRWKSGLLTLSDEQLDVPGFGQFPLGLDPELPFFGIIWWMNREAIHHLSGAMTLRDLHAAALIAGSDRLRRDRGRLAGPGAQMRWAAFQKPLPGPFIMPCSV